MALINAPDVAPIPPAAGRGRVLGPGARFAVSRVLSSLGTLVFVILFNFFLFRMLPGDPIALYTRGRDVDPEIRRQMQAKFNAPIAEQFIQYLKNPFVPELPSQQFSVPVWDVIVPRIGPTLLLVGTATVLATIFGVWLGIRSAWKRGERFDKVATTTTLVLYSMPEFWFGMILLIVFSVGVFGFPGIFPVGGLSTPGVDGGSFAGIADTAWHLVLPVFTLTVVYLAEYALVMRASLIDEMGQDYLQTARAKGLRDDEVRRKHAVPNAMLPTTTLIFLNLGFVIGGAITIEYVFSLPGLGSLTVRSPAGAGHTSAADALPVVLRRRDPGQPRRRPHLRHTRSAGADMTHRTDAAPRFGSLDRVGAPAPVVEHHWRASFADHRRACSV